MNVIATNITNLHLRMRDIIARVRWGNVICVLYRAHSPAAVMISPQEYERLTGQAIADLEVKAEKLFGEIPTGNSES